MPSPGNWATDNVLLQAARTGLAQVGVVGVHRPDHLPPRPCEHVVLLPSHSRSPRLPMRSRAARAMIASLAADWMYTLPCRAAQGQWLGGRPGSCRWCLFRGRLCERRATRLPSLPLCPESTVRVP
jgi:hypothetical protein